MEKQQIVENFASALQRYDVAALGELMHPEIVCRYPQSGETIRGRENYVAMLTNYPGIPHADVSSVEGDSKTAVIPSTTPFSPPTVTVFGGDRYILEGLATYPNGESFNIISIFRMQGSQIIEETAYFAAPFDAPEWRRQYVEKE